MTMRQRQKQYMTMRQKKDKGNTLRNVKFVGAPEPNST